MNGSLITEHAYEASQCMTNYNVLSVTDLS